MKSATQQYPLAQQQMAMLTYNKPEGKKESFEWTKKCAELGYPKCMATLAMHYGDGFGTNKNIDSMLSWTKRVALSQRIVFNEDNISSIASARLKLAKWYFEDRAVQMDLVQSYTWLLKFYELKNEVRCGRLKSQQN